MVTHSQTHTFEHVCQSPHDFSSSVARDEDSDVDIPEDEGSDSDIDDGQQPRPRHARHAQISGDQHVARHDLQPRSHAGHKRVTECT